MEEKVLIAKEWLEEEQENEYCPNYFIDHEVMEKYAIYRNKVLELPNAIKTLQKYLSEDKSEGSYYHTWQCNIAMAFQDEFFRECGYGDVSKELLHKIANQAAKDFLDLLIKQ